MRIFFLNLPAEVPIVRRYMCSSFAERYLFPPHDLLALAGIARGAGHEVYFTDAVAESFDTAQTLKKIEEIKPNLIISLLSFELFDKDVAIVKSITDKFKDTCYGLFGHYPTHFAEDTLSHTGADFVMLGEPDIIFERLLTEWTGTQLPTGVTGTVVRTGAAGFANNGDDRRVPNPNALPMPAYDMLKKEYYKEPFMASPTGLIQSARGCPFKCNYCVHSFGTKLTVLTPENVLKHIHHLKQIHQIKSLRFIDDTFTAIPSRVIKICKLMIEQNINLPWTCLSRADTLDEEMLHWMKKAGCVRINVGIESGSQRILDLLDKGLNVEEALINLQRARKAGLEVMGFFLTGIPGETSEDVDASIAIAKKTCHFIVVDTLKVYPGTPLFDKFKDLVTFSLVPYQNYFTDPVHNRIAAERRSYFYRKFYFSLGFLANSPKTAFTYTSHLRDTLPYVIKQALKPQGVN